MARLIEFFTRTGELVLDPFAGVGGTLLGAAIARGPRRAIGIELSPRWAEVYAEVVAERWRTRGGLGPEPGRPRPERPGRRATFDPSGCELRVGDALAVLPTCRRVGRLRGHRPALQRPAADDDVRRRAGRGFANRRTDYAMVTDDPADLANAADYPAFLDRMTEVLGEMPAGPAAGRYAVLIVRDAYQDGRYVFTGADLAARAADGRARPEGRPHLVPGRHAAAALRLSHGLRAEHRPPAPAGAPEGTRDH